MSFCLPPNMGWIFNTIVAANITGEATHRRATCGNASNPCTIKAVSVIGVARSTSCRGRYIGESPSRGEGFGAGQSRPVVLMSVLGGDRDGCGRTRPCDFACGLFAPHRDRLILAPPLAAPDRQCPVAGVVAWGKSILLHGFQKQIVVPRGVALQFLLQKHENIRNYLQFILHDVDRINLASREFR